jgi:leucyl aminopeptidase
MRRVCGEATALDCRPQPPSKEPDVTSFSYTNDPADAVRADLLILPVLQGDDGPVAGPGAASAGLLDAYAGARLKGKRGENLLVPGPGDAFAAGAALLVGMGARDEIGVDTVRRVLAKVAGTARRFGSVATTAAQVLPARRAAEGIGAVAEGLALGAYRFDRYRSAPDEGGLDAVTVLGSAKWDAKAMRAALHRADVVVDAVIWARDLVNTPAGDLPPAAIADAAAVMAGEVGLTCRVWDEVELADGGFGGILGVGKGSVNPPRMIELTYRGAGKATPIALTGKGIAFDSGGLSLKDPKGMEPMKDDMAGAASILATMKVIARLRLKVNVITAIPCSENMPSGSAQRPGDVIRHYGGTTSEVLNTDAEGRLVLADALAFLAEQNPQLIIDTATLTGSCMVALGEKVSGAFTNDRKLVREVIAAGDAVGEPTWEMPLFADYRTLIDSNVADIKNTGDRYGGAIAAAWFLAEFVGDTPWVHMDVAGPAWAFTPHDLGPRGGTGVPVRTLVRFLEGRAGA